MPLSVYSSFGHYMTQTRRMLDAYAGFFDRLKHAVISRRAFFAIGQIYFGIFQTSAGAIALFADGQYHLVSRCNLLNGFFRVDVDKEMMR